MASVKYAARAFSDLERLAEFLSQVDKLLARRTMMLIEEAVKALARHPFLGRPVESGLSELVVSHGKTGYLVLYRIDETHDVVMILAMRHQCEGGYFK